VRILKWTDHTDLAIQRGCAVSRREYLDHMTFVRNERPLFTEIFGPLIGLKEEWEAQGATPEELDFSAFRYRCAQCAYVPVNTGRLGGFEPYVVEETDEHLVSRDAYGRTMRLCKGSATLPLPLDHPVKSMDDWLAIKPWYEFSEARFEEGWQEQALASLRSDHVVAVSIPGGFDEPRQLMGEECLCLAFYDQPELVHDILHTIGDTAYRVLDRVSSSVQVDALVVHEDMAGKSGPLIGPKLVTAFLRPYYRRVWDMLASRGARLFDQDSDGNMNAVIAAFLDAGVNCMHPMEPAAGMDIVKVRQEYGARLAFYGGIDKHVLRCSKGEILAELEHKVPPLVASGGCVLALDHRIPNGTSLTNYRFYLDKVWDIMNREAAAL